MKWFPVVLACSLLVHAQEIKKRQLANYKEVEVLAPLTIHLVDEHDIVTLWCKTKHLTTVHLPDSNDPISYIGTGDDEKMWQVAGVGSSSFIVKPSDLADRTTAMVRTNAGKSFSFRLINLAVPDGYQQLFKSPEEEEAFQAYAAEMATYDPYFNVILKYRDEQLQISQANVLRQKKEALDAQIAEYRRLNQELEAKQARVEEAFYAREEERVIAYAAVVDYEYEVDYKTRRIKKKWPVHKVYNDGAFTWVEVDPGAPAFHVYEVRNGSFEVVNHQLVSDRLYRIDRVCDRLEFRDGPKGDWVFRISQDDHS